MRISMLSSLLLCVVAIGFAACSESEKEETEQSTEDTESEETDTEPTEDTGTVDTDTETEDTETEDTEVEDTEPRMDCTYEDLILQVEVRDSSGTCTNCNATDWMYADGLLYNPCGNDIAFSTPSNCIVEGGTVTGPSTLDIVNYCGGGAKDQLVEAGRTMLHPSSFGNLNPIDPGEYTLTLYFTSPFSKEVSFDFTAYH